MLQEKRRRIFILLIFAYVKFLYVNLLFKFYFISNEEEMKKEEEKNYENVLICSDQFSVLKCVHVFFLPLLLPKLDPECPTFNVICLNQLLWVDIISLSRHYFYIIITQKLQVSFLLQIKFIERKLFFLFNIFVYQTSIISNDGWVFILQYQRNKH